MVQAIISSDPALAPLAHRLRPRLQTLLGCQEALLLTWGEQNLRTAMEHSVLHAQISKRISQLDVSGWVHKCQEAATRIDSGGILGMFKAKESPEQYEARFRQLKTELPPLLAQVSKIIEEVQPEVEDLRLDVAALGAVAPRYTAADLMMIIQNRLRTLVTGHQTTVQLLASAEACKQTLLQNIQTLDQLLTVTLPAWRLANG
jgi:plasmid stabilization system protein ParE